MLTPGAQFTLAEFSLAVGLLLGAPDKTAFPSTGAGFAGDYPAFQLGGPAPQQ